MYVLHYMHISYICLYNNTVLLTISPSSTTPKEISQTHPSHISFESFSFIKNKKFYGKDQIFSNLDKRRIKYEDLLLTNDESDQRRVHYQRKRRSLSVKRRKRQKKKGNVSNIVQGYTIIRFYKRSKRTTFRYNIQQH